MRPLTGDWPARERALKKLSKAADREATTKLEADEVRALYTLLLTVPRDYFTAMEGRFL
jgi:hypothetical protein